MEEAQSGWITWMATPPEERVVALAQGQRRVAGMGRLQPQATAVQHQALEREGPLQHRHHNAAGARLHAAIDDQQITVMDAGLHHRIAAHAQEEGAAGAGDQLLVEVDAGFDVVVGGAGETGGHTLASQGQQQADAALAQGPGERLGLGR